MTGRRSHGRLSALNGVVHQGTASQHLIIEVLRRPVEFTQYLSMRYTERLADAGIALSVGSRGDAYNNALAETTIGLFKTEVIRRRGPWRHIDAVEFATLAWVDWFNTRRLLQLIGYIPIPPAEYEERYYEQATVASLTSFALRRSRYDSVEPTNNVAERALRTAVQWRKIMFGNRSAAGEQAVARLLTVTRTCHLQQLKVLAYLTAAIHSQRCCQPVASLLPKRLTP